MNLAETALRGKASRAFNPPSPIIGWHRRGLVPNGNLLAADARCRLVCADFFAMARGGLTRLRTFVKPGGVFALWSNKPPDPAFVALLTEAFGPARGHTVVFDNPIQGHPATNGVYVARAAARACPGKT